MRCWTIAAIVEALFVVAAAVAITIRNIISGTIRPFRWAAHVFCVISTVAVVVAAPLVIAPKVTIAVAEI